MSEQTLDALKNINSQNSLSTNSILWTGFSNDRGLLTCGTQNGFSIFTCFPFSENINRELGGGIKQVEILNRTNLIALIGGGSNPKYPENKVMIWDDKQKSCIAELSFRSIVKSVKLCKEYIVVVLEYKVYLYQLPALKLVDGFETAKNDAGLTDLKVGKNDVVMANLGLQIGTVRIDFINKKSHIYIDAHRAKLAYLTLNSDHTILATASEKGTMVRLYDTTTGKLIHEFRRGINPAKIYCITFSTDSQFLAVLSDTGTVHIYSLASHQAIEPQNSSVLTNITSWFSPAKSYLPQYFSSTWSMKQFRIKEISCKTILTFSEDNKSLLIISSDGSSFSIVFDLNSDAAEYTVDTHVDFVKKSIL